MQLWQKLLVHCISTQVDWWQEITNFWPHGLRMAPLCYTHWKIHLAWFHIFFNLHKDILARFSYFTASYHKEPAKKRKKKRKDKGKICTHYETSTIKMGVLWIEISYLKTAATFLSRIHIEKGLELSKYVSSVFVGQGAAKIWIVKLWGWSRQPGIKPRLLEDWPIWQISFLT